MKLGGASRQPVALEFGYPIVLGTAEPNLGPMIVLLLLLRWAMASCFVRMFVRFGYFMEELLRSIVCVPQIVRLDLRVRTRGFAAAACEAAFLS